MSDAIATSDREPSSESDFGVTEVDRLILSNVTSSPVTRSPIASSLDFGVQPHRQKDGRRGGGGGEGGERGRGGSSACLDPHILHEQLCQAQEDVNMLLEFAQLVVAEINLLKQMLKGTGIKVPESLNMTHKVPELRSLQGYPKDGGPRETLDAASVVRKLAALTFSASWKKTNGRDEDGSEKQAAAQKEEEESEEEKEEEEEEEEEAEAKEETKEELSQIIQYPKSLVARPSSAPVASTVTDLQRRRGNQRTAVPTFYLQDLLVIIRERNELKLKVLEFEEQLKLAKDVENDTEDDLCALPRASQSLPRGVRMVIRPALEPKDCYITDVSVVGYKKHGRNSVYMIQTTWSDRNRYEIYRRYGEFFTFQNTLQQLFPVEAGKSKNNPRVLPTLPSIDNLLSVLGRTNSESVLKSRLVTINNYCQTLLLRMDVKISRSTFVVNFFKLYLGDRQLERLGLPSNSEAIVLSVCPLVIPAGSVFEEYTVLADYQPTGDSEISAKAGDIVKVVKKDEMPGWWLVEKQGGSKGSKRGYGYIPGSFLRRDELQDTVEIHREYLGFVSSAALGEINSSLKYSAIDDYFPDDGRQISFLKGEVLIVVDKSEDGWWLVTHNGKEGWAPASYLEPVGRDTDIHETDDDSTIPEPAQKYTAREAYTAQLEDEVSFPQNAVVDVLEKSLSGWWRIRYNGEMGVAPSSLLHVQRGLNPNCALPVALSHSTSGIVKPPPRRELLMSQRQREHSSSVVKEEVPDPTPAFGYGSIHDNFELSGSLSDTESELFMRNIATRTGNMGRKGTGPHFRTRGFYGFPGPQSVPNRPGPRGAFGGLGHLTLPASGFGKLRRSETTADRLKAATLRPVSRGDWAEQSNNEN